MDELAAARAHSDPWFRAQALAHLARYAPDQDSLERLFRESLEAARACDEPYKRVAVAAWPVRAAVERGLVLPTGLVHRLLQEADRIEQPSSRVEALELLWQGIFPLGPAGRARVESAFVEACFTADTWRAPRALVCFLQVLVTREPERARALLERMPPGRSRRRAERLLPLARPEWSVREFFWDGSKRP